MLEKMGNSKLILLAEKLRKTNILCWIGSKRDLDELTSKYPFLEQEIKKSNKIQSIKDTINLMTGMKLFIDMILDPHI